MSQVPSLTIEYGKSRATVCPTDCDTDGVVLVQLSDFPQRFPADSEAIPHGALLDSPAWVLGAIEPGKETR
jgi:hypothetical protein